MSINSSKSRPTAADRRDYIIRNRPKWLHGAEAACYASVKRERLYLALATGALMGHRIGRRYRVQLDQVDAWISAGCPTHPASSPCTP
jgi:excisionase family DNA binding protein